MSGGGDHRIDLRTVTFRIRHDRDGRKQRNSRNNGKKEGKTGSEKRAVFLRLHGEEQGKKTPDFLLRSGLGSNPKNPLFSFLESPFSFGNSPI